MSTPVITFIGGGNMAEAVFGGLYQKGHPKTHLRISEPLEARRQYLTETYPGVMATNDNHEAVDGANVVILAVKPQVLHAVVTDLAPTLHKNPTILVVSVAAGIETRAILAWINASYAVPLVRTMPNTPALMSEGAVGLFATDCVTPDHKALTERVLGSVSKVLTWVHSESLVDTVTGVSGSGPAYFFLFMEAMSKYFSCVYVLLICY
jgi:pyrroline-5-carboxylate reductase